MDEIKLSEYGYKSTTPSPINRLMSDFAADFREGVDVNLGGGYVNEQTMPREQIRAALAQVLQQSQRFRQPLNYGGPRGSLNLLSAIQEFLVGQRGGGLTKQLLAQREIIVGPSGATSLLEALANVLPRGIVVTSDPMYYVYTDLLERRGFEMLTVPEDGEGIRIDALREKLAQLGDRVANVRFFYVVTINNPSCTILSNERRRALIDLAWDLSQQVGRKVPVMLDCAYEDLVHEGQDVHLESGLLHDPGGIVYEIGTLSKVLAPALRIGYMVGPGGDFVKAMVQRTSDVGFSAPLINQEIASLLLENQIAAQLKQVRAGYGAKARAVRGWLDELLHGELISISGGRAGFYFYLTFRDVETHNQSAFFHFLARTTGRPEVDRPGGQLGARVIYIPGHYCVHPRGDLAQIGQRQLRIAYGFEELENIHRAIGLMKEAAQYARSQ